MMTKNQSDGLTEAACSIEIGRYKRMIFRRIVLFVYWRDESSIIDRFEAKL